ncbi:MAG: hypothetical protein KDA63_11730 [Planctomycetales bacterium]|nr:hypothetical protein [Planctomycetales bacterium]
MITIAVFSALAAYYRNPRDTWFIWQFPLYAIVSFYTVYCRNNCHTTKSAALSGAVVSFPAVFVNAAILGYAGVVPVWDEKPSGLSGALMVPLEVLIITFLSPLVFLFWPFVLALGAAGGLAGQHVGRWATGVAKSPMSESAPSDTQA